MPPVGPRSSLPPGCGRPELGRRLPEWELLEPLELAELEAHAATCPRCGPQLELLRRADAWLSARTPRSGVGPCPEPERLYAAAGGPGAEPLPAEERTRIEEHLSRCQECAGFAATLRHRPPSPLILDPEPAPRERPPALRPVRGPLPRRSRLRLVPLLAAAAGLILGLALWRAWTSSGPQAQEPLATAPRFPQGPLLRGELGGPLLYPRVAVLARQDGELVHLLEFELEPQEGASAYRVVLTRRADDVESLRVDGESPRLPAGTERLAPGAYTWEAWAVVHGLDVPLGRRDFEVRHDPAVLGELERLDALPEPERSERALALLVDAGLYADARAWARTLPATPERDAFLERAPGR